MGCAVNPGSVLSGRVSPERGNGCQEEGLPSSGKSGILGSGVKSSPAI